MTGVIPVSARRHGRRYDEERDCYVYDISFKTRSLVTPRTLKVAEAFGLGIDREKEHIIYRDFELRLAEGDVVYITGDSGSGKSVLLRAIEEDLGPEAINISDVDIDPGKALIDTVGCTFREGLRLLSRVGLNDAFLFLRQYSELSDGQRYRYKIARMIDSSRRFWLCDEFCSTLDRTTAKIVAYNIQKLARRSDATLIVATTHTDLMNDLNPSVLITKGWGEEIEVEYRENLEAPGCTMSKDITIREGSRDDYDRLSHLHYRKHDVRFVLKFFAMERKGELIGVIAYCCPPVFAGGRRKAVGYNPRLKELNRDWTIISRVVVHPKYRTIGLGARLVRETLPLCGCRYVELIAVMSEYNPFAEHAGMKRIQETEPHPSVWTSIEGLRKMGFEPIMMASEAYNRQRLEELTDDEIDKVREILLGVSTHYYKRLSRGWRNAEQPYIRKHEMRDWLWEQDLEGLAKSLRILSVLSETKVYLFWSRDWTEDGKDG